MLMQSLRYSAMLVLLCVLGGLIHFHPAASLKTQRPLHLAENYGKLPLRFEANDGQADPRVKYISGGPGYALLLTEHESILTLSQKDKGVAVYMELSHGNAHARLKAMEKLPGTTNYFIGNDPAKWRTNIVSYGRVAYEQVYTGIDLVYYGNQNQLEYDFVVSPGANPSDISMTFWGAEKLEITPQGDLRLGDVSMHRPVVYQEIAGRRHHAEGHYVLRAQNEVGFDVADYDRSQPLVIDPTLSYATYIGDPNLADHIAYGAAADSSENAYVTGYIRNDFHNPSTLPTPGAFQTAWGNSGTFHAFVAKMNAAGSGLIYFTYLGGSGSTDIASQIKVDSAGNAYVVGYTSSSDFPTTVGVVQSAFGGGNYDGFVTELNPNGTGLVFSTFLGGSSDDFASGIAFDTTGIYASGSTNSSNFPVANALQASIGGNRDTFVVKMNPTASAFIYSTYLGGPGDDPGGEVAVDTNGNAYISGYAQQSFPLVNAAQPNYGGGDYDGFVAKLNPTGSALVFSTYLGGPNGDTYGPIAVDASGNVYVGGNVRSNGCNPCTYQPAVAKYTPTGTLVYSSILHANGNTALQHMAVDGAGNLYIVGYTNAANFNTQDAVQTYAGGYDAFVAKINSAGTGFSYSTYLGGSGDDYGYGIGIDSAGNAYVSGQTASTNFPATGGAFQTAYPGVRSIFVAKLALNDPVPAITSITPSVVTAGGPTFNLVVQGSGFAGDSVVMWNGTPLVTTFINTSQIEVFGVPSSYVANAGTVPITVFNPAPGGGTSNAVSLTVASPGGAVVAGSGSTTIPVSVALNNGVSIDSMSFGLAITPNGTAPALTTALTFIQDAALPTTPSNTFADTSAGPNLLAVSWLPFSSTLSGTVKLGTVNVTLPTTAAPGQTYTVQITGAHASLSNAAIGLLSSTTTLTVGGTYLVGDTYPDTGDSVGQFGDNVLNTFDLIYSLRAVVNLPGSRPLACSDRFDVMDSFPADTTSSRGGDGALNNLDLITTLRRVTNVDTFHPTRVTRGLVCTARYEVPELPDPSTAAGVLEFGAPEGQRVPLYLDAHEPLALSGLSFGLGVGGGRFIPSDGLPPSLLDEELPGNVAVAWLQNIVVSAGDRLLLGYVVTNAGGALRFYGASANARSDGHTVAIGARGKRQIE